MVGTDLIVMANQTKWQHTTDFVLLKTENECMNALKLVSCRSRHREKESICQVRFSGNQEKCLEGRITHKILFPSRPRFCINHKEEILSSLGLIF